MRTQNLNQKKQPPSNQNSEIKSLQNFQHSVATSLLTFTSDGDEKVMNSRLVSAMLFLLHLSGEIVKSFTFGDEEDSKELMEEAIEESKLAYKNKTTLDSESVLNKSSKFLN